MFSLHCDYQIPNFSKFLIWIKYKFLPHIILLFGTFNLFRFILNFIEIFLSRVVN